MKKTNADPVREVLERGVSEVIVKKELETLIRSKKKIKLYLGIDPTGKELHLGHTIALRKLRQFQNLGHEVYFLVGSFTALIGDTSDKNSMRPPMTPEQIEENFKTYKAQAAKILDFSKTTIVYNGEWLSKLKLADILNLANKFTVQQMIERDMYQERLKQGKPIGLHEFLYPLMQGYDSVELNVDLEVGGNDQLFNMLAGRTLQKVLNSRDKHVMTMQLIEGTDGRKMAKTYGNVININDEPADMYGKIMSMSDRLIGRYFELCTDVPMEEISAMEEEMMAGANPRDFKMRLGREIVAMYHGAKASGEAEERFITVFRKHDVPDDIEEKILSKGEWNIIDVLVETKLAPSKSEARRLVTQGGVKVDESGGGALKKVEEIEKMITIGDHLVLIQVGKRRFLSIRKK